MRRCLMTRNELYVRLILEDLGDLIAYLSFDED